MDGLNTAERRSEAAMRCSSVGPRMAHNLNVVQGSHGFISSYIA